MPLLRWTRLLAIVSCTALSACTEHMIPTPYVMYGERGREIFAEVPESLRTNDVKVFYVTDRSVERTTERGPEYGFGRAKSFTYGVATVQLGEDVTWDELVADSTSATRVHTYIPKVTHVEELGQFPTLASLMEARDRRLFPKPSAAAELLESEDILGRALQPFIAQAERKDAVVFVHGFNNSFDDAVVRIAQAWHLAGRQGIPIVYTWPAGAGVFEYARDRESGEFTIVHLKLFLCSLARCQQIERVHVVSHSRGTDVATTAIRELNAELRGAGQSLVVQSLRLTPYPTDPSAKRPTTADLLKLHTLVLAAPDIDLEVFQQRFIGEALVNSARRVVIYFSPTDKALDWAGWLFGSQKRLGMLALDDFTPEMRSLLAQLDQPELVQCDVSGTSSHSYLLQHPGAFSDLILMLRDSRAPGAANGRPLKEPFPGLWEMDDDYLKPTK